MTIVVRENECAVVRFTKHELVILNNSIGESLEALEDWEYPTRVGGEKNEARELLSEIGKLIDAF